jgi:hypothetical protein
VGRRFCFEVKRRQRIDGPHMHIVVAGRLAGDGNCAGSVICVLLLLAGDEPVGERDKSILFFQSAIWAGEKDYISYLRNL